MKKLFLLPVIAATFLAVSTSGQVATYPSLPALVKLPKVINPKDGYIGGGTVNVRVTVNENGDVTGAEFVSGPGPVCGWIERPDVLRTREAGIELAKLAKFTPATDGGVAIASSTIVSIEFAAPKPKTQKASSNEKFTVIGDSNYSAASTKDKTTGDSPVTPNTVKPASPPEHLTIVPDAGTTPVETSTGADPGNTDGRKTISGGVLNGKALSLPKPKYPAAARAVRASGAVQVQVLIDEDGNVFSAEATGHPLLRFASATAACSSKFTPTLLAGEPVKVSGIIVYNFVP
jgi:outer membrane biosynthesis protein TonB